MDGFTDEGIEAKSIHSIGSNQLISPGEGKLWKRAEKEQLKLLFWIYKFPINVPDRRTKEHTEISGTTVLQLRLGYEWAA